MGFRLGPGHERRAWQDRPAEKPAVGGDHVDGDRRAAIHDHGRTPGRLQQAGRRGGRQAVDPDLVRLVEGHGERQVEVADPPLPEAPLRRGIELPQLWREWHGVERGRPDWAQWSHSLAWSLVDAQRGPILWCGMNAYHRAMHFDLPEGGSGWLRVIDTALPADQDLPGQPEPWLPPGAPLESRSLMLLVAPALVEGVDLDGSAGS